MLKQLTKQQLRKREYNRRYRLEHSKELNKKRRKYRAAHREEIARSHREWELAHPEKMAIYRKRKNALRRQLRREARRLEEERRGE